MSHKEIWYVLELEDDNKDDLEEGKAIVVFNVKPQSLRRNTTEFSLEAVVRHYCQARIHGPTEIGRPSTTRLESGQLYDILGLLRALQYDIVQYNQVAAAYAATTEPQETPLTMSRNERLYACFRLIHHALTLGVRLTPLWLPREGNKPASKLVHIPGLDELVTHVEQEFASRLEHGQRNLEQGVVDFDSLMELYKPGSYLLDYGLLSGLQHSSLTPLLILVRASHYARGKSATGKLISTFHAACEFVVATGRGQFAVVEARLMHHEFKGTRRVEDSSGTGATGRGATGEVCIKASNPTVLHELKERGRIYQEICRISSSSSSSSATSGTLVHYTAGSFWPVRSTFSGQGSAASNASSRGTAGRSSRTGGRLMVDTVEAWTRGIHAAKAPADGVAGEAVAEAFKAVARLNRQQEKAAEVSTSSPKGADEDDDEDLLVGDVLLLQEPLPDSLIQRTWPVVCGFSLETRMWGLALVDGITPVQFQEQAFDELVLPAARKRLVRALITSHGQTQAARGVDVLPGKGEGIIFLLHGPAGVGKTLTAEAVSEVLHRPLYRVSMGELGVTPENLENRLQEIFDLCLPWQALVLIDEAEMLLEKRTHTGSDLVRNAMVCVMLRLMEYYPGILFLTTNSGKDRLDPAIASRLTCTLGYDSLSQEGRREVWRTTLGRIETTATTSGEGGGGGGLVSQISDADLDYLAKEYQEINGRQIKNAVQLAGALCRYEKSPLQLSQLKETLEMTNVLPNGTDTDD